MMNTRSLTTHLDHVSRCKASPVTNWPNRWTNRVFTMNTRRDWIEMLISSEACDSDCRPRRRAGHPAPGPCPFHPGVEFRANLKSISHRCHLFEVSFVWKLTKETIHLPPGCLQGGSARPYYASKTLHPNP